MQLFAYYEKRWHTKSKQMSLRTVSFSTRCSMIASSEASDMTNAAPLHNDKLHVVEETVRTRD